MSAAPAPGDGGTTLFCIPHAGGSAAYYARLGELLRPHVAFRPLELPGHGRRHREPLLPDLEALASDLFAHVAPTALRGPYALFGHSMGALLAFRCAVLAREAGLPAPSALFVSAASAPVPEERRPALSTLPTGELWTRIEAFGGVPQCVAESHDFLQYLEPILRADLAAVETWRPQPVTPLATPITVFLGDGDGVTPRRGELWRQTTSATFDMRVFSGGHFYLQDNWEALARHMERVLAPR